MSEEAFFDFIPNKNFSCLIRRGEVHGHPVNPLWIRPRLIAVVGPNTDETDGNRASCDLCGDVRGPNLQNFVKCTYGNVTTELRIVYEKFTKLFVTLRGSKQTPQTKIFGHHWGGRPRPVGGG